MEDKLKTASKFISLLLRHKPETIGLELDECGWVKIDKLIEKSQVLRSKLSRTLIENVVQSNDKQRFSISDDGAWIRANQGHSIPVNLNLVAVEPPEYLYHGTATRFLDDIQKQGLLKKNRQHVHLTDDLETAKKVGVRHGKLAVLKVKSGEMNAVGHCFYQSLNGVWLTEHVPNAYLIVS